MSLLTKIGTKRARLLGFTAMQLVSWWIRNNHEGMETALDDQERNEWWTPSRTARRSECRDVKERDSFAIIGPWAEQKVVCVRLASNDNIPLSTTGIPSGRVMLPILPLVMILLVMATFAAGDFNHGKPSDHFSTCSTFDGNRFIWSHADEMLQCVCTTRACQELGEPVCNTPGLCYSQFLDRKDGSNPVTKGCIKYALDINT